MTIKFLNIFILLFSLQTWAGGTSIIGNGAGICENNFQFAYSSLENYVNSCLNKNNCEMSPNENKILTNILSVLRQNISNEHRIIYISEKQHPGFFDTGINEVHRIAKTGLTPDVPIYINSDLLYNDLGKPTLDISTIFSVLIHEVGHQTGETNHAKLDIIGSKLKKIINQKITTQKINIGNGKLFEVNILNQNFPFLLSNLIVAWETNGSKNITQQLMKSISCSDISSNLSGFEIYNGHFNALNLDNNTIESINYGVWVDIYCYSSSFNQNSTETLSIDLNIDSKLNIQITNKSVIK